MSSVHGPQVSKRPPEPAIVSGGLPLKARTQWKPLVSRRVQAGLVSREARGEERGVARHLQDVPLCHGQKATLLGVGMDLARPVVPFYPFLGEGSPSRKDYRKKLVPLF